MATINSAASGSFNSGATWVGGVVPTVGDTAVALAGHTITIDSNVTCDEVTNANNTGHFLLTDGFTLTADVTGGATIANNGTLRYNGTTSASIIGNVTQTQNVLNISVIFHTNTGTLNITGNIQANTGSGARYAIFVNATGTLNITGDINASSATPINIAGNSAVVNLTGNIAEGGSGNAIVSTGNSVTINVTGNITGGTVNSNTSNGIEMRSVNGAINVTGSVNAGSGTTTTFGGTSAIFVTAAATNAIVDIVGSLNASETQHAIVGGFTAQFIISGNINHNMFGKPAFNVSFLRVRVTTGAVTTYATPAIGAGTPVIRASMDYITNNVPVPGDVREGLSYADDQFEGTLAVPPAGSVALGVPTDNTVGTAALTPEAVWEYVIGASDAETLLSNTATATNVSNSETVVTGAISSTETSINNNVDAAETAILESITDNAITAQDVWDYEVDTDVAAGDRLLDTATSSELAEAGITVEEIWDHPLTDVTLEDTVGDKIKNVATVESTGSQIAAFEDL